MKCAKKLPKASMLKKPGFQDKQWGILAHWI